MFNCCFQKVHQFFQRWWNGRVRPLLRRDPYHQNIFHNSDDEDEDEFEIVDGGQPPQPTQPPQQQTVPQQPPQLRLHEVEADQQQQQQSVRQPIGQVEDQAQGIAQQQQQQQQRSRKTYRTPLPLRKSSRSKTPSRRQKDFDESH